METIPLHTLKAVLLTLGFIVQIAWLRHPQRVPFALAAAGMLLIGLCALWDRDVTLLIGIFLAYLLLSSLWRRP